MKKQQILLLLILLIFCPVSFSQNYSIDKLKLEYDGYKLSITYDLSDKNMGNLFFIRVDIMKQNGTPVRAKSFEGDIGDNIIPGKNKSITWIPQDDAIFLDDSVTVEVKCERHEKLFNKGSMMAISTLIPGLGQTKISNGKPWWIVGIPAYGTLAGGVIFYNKYLNTYDSYTSEMDQVARADLLAKSQDQKNISGSLLISAAAIWIGNLVWVAATPNKFKPLQLPKLSFYNAPGNSSIITMLSLKVEF